MHKKSWSIMPQLCTIQLCMHMFLDVTGFISCTRNGSYVCAIPSNFCISSKS